MLDWFKKIGKDYPEFWKNYLQKTENTPTTKVALYLETTGINAVKDKIISIGAVTIHDNQIIIQKTLEIDLDKKVILESSDLTTIEIDAIEALINFIGNATLIGHRIHYDIEILNEYLSKMQCGRIKNDQLDLEIMQSKILDQLSKKFPLNDLMEYYKIKNPEVVTSGNLAFSIGLLFLKMKKKLNL